MNTARFQDLIDSPLLPRIVETLTAVVEQERRARAEFYATVRDDQKAEFINGEVIYHSPAKHRHNRLSTHIVRLLANYVHEHQLGFVAVEKAMISLTRNDYEPDICFWTASRAATFDPDLMHYPAPDFVVEIPSRSTAARDRGVKREDYAAHGVREYWIVDPVGHAIEQYVLEGDCFALVTTKGEGTITSVAVPGWAFDVTAAFAG